jgi:hypothetical protein
MLNEILQLIDKGAIEFLLGIGFLIISINYSICSYVHDCLKTDTGNSSCID